MNPNSHIRYGWIAGILLIMLTPAAATACVCPNMPYWCNIEWKRDEPIFLGKVTAKDLITINAEYRIAVRFSVTDSLLSDAAVGQEIVVYTSAGSCGYPFIVGNTYLVYARTHQNQLSTSICSQTGPAVKAAAVIRELRAVRDGKRRASLFGTIGVGSQGAGDENLIESKVLAGIRVRAIGSNVQAYTTTTNEQGAYSFAWLFPDTYRLEVDWPPGLNTRQQNPGKPLTVQVVSGAGCRADVFASPDGQISGVVVDSTGRAITGFVTIKPADPKAAEAAGRRGGLPGYSTEDGKFSLWQIPPGRYQLLFNPKINGQVSFMREASRSEVIDLGFGQHIENFQFKVATSNNQP